MNAKSLEEVNIFLHSSMTKCYVWVYSVKHKSKIFDRFLEWKALVENVSGHKRKVFHTENGGEFISTKFESSSNLRVLHECMYGTKEN